MLPIELSAPINPLTSFLKNLTLSSPPPPPTLPKLNLLTGSAASSYSDTPSYKDFDILMHEETMPNPTVEEPPEPTNTSFPPHRNYPLILLMSKHSSLSMIFLHFNGEKKMLQMYAWLEAEL